ncbi:MAG TPA: hypothetical protein VGE85_17800 [Terracidiphilus sp.]|jgi:hypothetical protein
MKWVAGGMLTALAIAAAGVGVALKRAEPFLRKAVAFQLHRLQLYEIVNVRLHPLL